MKIINQGLSSLSPSWIIPVPKLNQDHYKIATDASLQNVLILLSHLFFLGAICYKITNGLVAVIADYSPVVLVVGVLFLIILKAEFQDSFYDPQ